MTVPHHRNLDHGRELATLYAQHSAMRFLSVLASRTDFINPRACETSYSGDSPALIC
jgi:hypothetical protein